MGKVPKRIPVELLRNYTDSIEALSDWNKSLLLQQLRSVDWSDETRAISQCVKIMQGVCAGTTQQAQEMARQFYMGLREMELGEGGYAGAATAEYDPKPTERAVRGMAQKLVDGNPEAFVSGMVQRVGYETKASAGDTLYRLGMNDPRKPRFARIPRRTKSYLNGCPFCQMLASRGFVYLSKESAGELRHYHDDCSCAICPSWKWMDVEGYDRHDYEEGYQKWLDADHSQHKENAKGKRRARWKDGRLRAGYEGKRIDQQEAMSAEQKAAQRRKNVQNQHEGWKRAHEQKKRQSGS